MREPVDGVHREPDQLEQFLYTLAPLASRHQVVEHERLTDELAHRVPGVERADRVLEHYLHLPAQVLERARPQ